jgi:hypothetical protein
MLMGFVANLWLSRLSFLCVNSNACTVVVDCSLEVKRTNTINGEKKPGLHICASVEIKRPDNR